MNHARSLSRGFTIVELLIVIVIIAILAAITIVAFNGIQQRAENAKTVSALNAYKKILKQYHTLREQHVTTGGMCLGDQYPLLSSTAEGCRRSSAVIVNMTSAQKTALGEVASSFPMPSTKKYSNSSGTDEFMGIWFYGTGYNYKIDGEARGWIQYVYGATECPETSYTLASSASGGYDATPITSGLNRYQTVNSSAVLCLSPVL